MSDREIDALVAEKVMGWTPRFTNQRDGMWVCAVGVDGEWAFRSEIMLPSFTGNIAAAWKVVEKMKQDGNEKTELELVGDTWEVCIPGAEGYAQDKSVTRAICLAALRAVGVEVPS